MSAHCCIKLDLFINIKFWYFKKQFSKQYWEKYLALKLEKFCNAALVSDYAKPRLSAQIVSNSTT